MTRGPAAAFLRGVLTLAPASWRETIELDVLDEARLRQAGAWWCVWQALLVVLALRWSLTGDAIMSDFRLAFRSLMRAPLFTVGAVSTFAVGIGVNVAVFSLVDRLLFRPLPYQKPADLVVISPAEGGRAYLRTPKPLVLGARTARELFSDVAVAGQASGYAIDPANPDLPPVRLTSATYNMLEVLGVRPEIGRDFTKDEALERRRVALITHEVWQRRFGADRSVVGRLLGSGANSLEIIGVLPARFTPPSMFWQQPTDGLSLDFDLLETAAPREGVWPPVARLRPGASIATAQAAMNSIALRVSSEAAAGQPPVQALVQPLQDALFGRFHVTLWLVVSAAAMVLLIACANLSSLLLARGRGRELNVALCSALGASSSRLIAVTLVESLVVAAAGGLAALLALQAAGGALTALEPAALRQFAVVSPDARVVLVAVGAVLLCTVVAGVLPAWRVLRVDVQAVLQRGAKAGSRRTRSFASRSLLGAEAAFGMLLVSGAILTGRSLIGLVERELGFVPHDLFVISAFLPDTDPAASKMAMYGRARDILTEQPGVVSVGGIDGFPIGGSAYMRAFPAPNRIAEGGLAQVAGRYFETIGAHVVAGRTLNDGDAEHDAMVAVVSARGARVLWPGVPPELVVGKTLSIPNEPDRTIVGVVADQRTSALRDPAASAFVPFGHADPKLAERVAVMELVVRAQDGRAPDLPGLRERLRAEFPQVTVSGRTAESLLEPWMQQPKFQAYLFGSFALSGLLLAAIGLYAVASFDVALRKYEMGVRMTLGARPGQIHWEVVKTSLLPVAAGVAAGLVATVWASQFLQSLLEGVHARDPILIGAAAATLIGAAALAAWGPARRAAHTDPAIVLRAN